MIPPRYEVNNPFDYTSKGMKADWITDVTALSGVDKDKNTK